jgi:uncharacterized protein YecT (DUF1311 family)
MKSFLLGVAAASAVLLATSMGLLAASETDMSKQYTTCMDKANGASPDMIDCIMAETKQQDARLNENYKRLLSKFSEERKGALLEAQRAWIRFRDANCAFWDIPRAARAQPSLLRSAF